MLIIPREGENTKTELRNTFIVPVKFSLSLPQIDIALGELKQDVVGIMAKEHHETEAMISIGIGEHYERNRDRVMKKHDLEVLALCVHEQSRIDRVKVESALYKIDELDIVWNRRVKIPAFYNQRKSNQY